MATTNLITKSVGDLTIQHGNGSPNHTAAKGSLYIDKDDEVWYKNTDGATTWDTMPDQTAVQALIDASVGTVPGSVATVDATPAEVDKIDTLTDNATHLIEVDVVCKDDADVEYGTWSFVLSVTKFNGTVTIREKDLIHHKSSAGLNASSVDFAVNAGDIDIDVTGIAATNIQWNSEYCIKVIATN